MARHLVQGCDIWLNNPRRPLEASGTSGMKAAVNGVLNVSVLDGWWDEACEAHPGWAIGRGEDYAEEQYQDEVGMQVPLRAEVALGELAPADVRIERCVGRLNAQQEFVQTTTPPLDLAESNGEGTHYFTGTFVCTESGLHGYTLRVVPSHRDLSDPLEMGLVRWA